MDQFQADLRIFGYFYIPGFRLDRTDQCADRIVIADRSDRSSDPA